MSTGKGPSVYFLLMSVVAPELLMFTECPEDDQKEHGLLMIKRLAKPTDTVSGFWYVHCHRARPPASVEEVVQDIIRYATYPVGAYRTTPAGAVEYLVEFAYNDGSTPRPTFYTATQLREVARNMLEPYLMIGD